MTKLTLKETCGACPEAYDAFLGDKYVGYLRLRHGYFAAYVVPEGPLSDHRRVYEAEPNGDGIFESDEREYFLNEGSKAILQNLNRPPEDGLYFEYGSSRYDA